MFLALLAYFWWQHSTHNQVMAVTEMFTLNSTGVLDLLRGRAQNCLGTFPQQNMSIDNADDMHVFFQCSFPVYNLPFSPTCFSHVHGYVPMLKLSVFLLQNSCNPGTIHSQQVQLNLQSWSLCSRFKNEENKIMQCFPSNNASINKMIIISCFK